MCIRDRYKTRAVVVTAISDVIYRGIKAFDDVGDINAKVTTIQPI